MMLRNVLKSAGLLMIMLISLSSAVMAQKSPIEGFWFNDEKTGKIQIYKDKDMYFGKIVWMKNDPDKKDLKNPDEKLRTRPIMGMVILEDFKKRSQTVYDDGSIYDPTSGKTYSCKITYNKDNTLSIRGYIGMSLLGKTTTWTPAPAE